MRWSHWAYIPQLMADFEEEVLGTLTPCRTGDTPKVAKDIAVVHGELMAIHPFRDGNGRVGRLVAVLMGLQAGVGVMGFDGTEKGRERYLAAVAAAFMQDYEPLTDVFAEALASATEPA